MTKGLPKEKKGQPSLTIGLPTNKEAKGKVRGAQKQEDRLAGKMGGTRNPGSGNVRGRVWETTDRRGDVIAKDWTLEAKHTKHASYRVTEDTISKARAEALLYQTDWGLAIQIEGFADKSLPSRFVLVDEDVYMRLVESERQLEKLQSIAALKASSEE